MFVAKPDHPAPAPSQAVLITGSSSGIGAACALDLDRRGYTVFAGVRSPAHGRRLQQKATPRLVPILIDVTDRSLVAAAAEKISSTVGERGLAGLVNNAGVLYSAPLEFVAQEQLRRQFEVNVFGVVATTQAMLPSLRKARGRIVNIGSITGKAAPPYLGPYAASKFALEAITDVMRMELRSWGIQVALIEPDNVVTPIWDKLETAPEKQTRKLPPEAEALYEQDLLAARKAAYAMGKTGMPVDRVVRAVRHALGARRPKTRYPIGLRTRLAFWAAGRVPDRIRDFFMLRQMGMR